MSEANEQSVARASEEAADSMGMPLVRSRLPYPLSPLRHSQIRKVLDEVGPLIDELADLTLGAIAPEMTFDARWTEHIDD